MKRTILLMCIVALLAMLLPACSPASTGGSQPPQIPQSGSSPSNPYPFANKIEPGGKPIPDEFWCEKCIYNGLEFLSFQGSNREWGLIKIASSGDQIFINKDGRSYLRLIKDDINDFPRMLRAMGYLQEALNEENVYSAVELTVKNADGSTQTFKGIITKYLGDGWASRRLMYGWEGAGVDIYKGYQHYLDLSRAGVQNFDRNVDNILIDALTGKAACPDLETRFILLKTDYNYMSQAEYELEVRHMFSDYWRDYLMNLDNPISRSDLESFDKITDYIQKKTGMNIEFEIPVELDFTNAETQLNSPWWGVKSVNGRVLASHSLETAILEDGTVLSGGPGKFLVVSGTDPFAPKVPTVVPPKQEKPAESVAKKASDAIPDEPPPPDAVKIKEAAVDITNVADDAAENAVASAVESVGGAAERTMIKKIVGAAKTIGKGTFIVLGIAGTVLLVYDTGTQLFGWNGEQQIGHQQFVQMPIDGTPDELARWFPMPDRNVNTLVFQGPDVMGTYAELRRLYVTGMPKCIETVFDDPMLGITGSENDYHPRMVKCLGAKPKDTNSGGTVVYLHVPTKKMVIAQFSDKTLKWEIIKDDGIVIPLEWSPEGLDCESVFSLQGPPLVETYTPRCRRK